MPSGRASRSVPDFDCAFSEIYSGSVRSFAVFVVPRFCLQKEKTSGLVRVCVCVRVGGQTNPSGKKEEEENKGLCLSPIQLLSR